MDRAGARSTPTPRHGTPAHDPTVITGDDTATEQFACSGDDGASFVSSDGTSWTEIAIDTVRLCEGGLAPRSECPSLYHDGVFLSAEWGGSIRRSLTGGGWMQRYQDDFGNNVFTEYAFGVGRVAP